MNESILRPSTTYPEVIGATLAVLRDKVKVSQQSLAESVGVSPSTWSRIERARSALTICQLAKASATLGLTPGAIASMADAAAVDLRSRGVEVVPQRESAPVAMIDGRVKVDPSIIFDSLRSLLAAAG